MRPGELVAGSWSLGLSLAWDLPGPGRSCVCYLSPKVAAKRNAKLQPCNCRCCCEGGGEDEGEDEGAGNGAFTNFIWPRGVLAFNLLQFCRLVFHYTQH